MVRLGLIIVLLFGGSGFRAEAKIVEVPKASVVLVHGIMNRPIVMDRLARTLKAEGYAVHNWGYASRGGMIEEHSKRLVEFIQKLPSDRPIHFVGFSQGAIIIRYTLTHQAIPNAGRFVMIAPPNHGCEMAEDFYQYRWFRGLYGDKSIKQLFAKQNDFLKTVGIPTQEFGIIAGGKGDDKGFSSRIPGDDDGTISVASSRLEGSRDFILLPHMHTPLVWSADTARQAIYFLNHGVFQR
jgi:pimeloyl-ACP methyl ester carboxylesterase